MQKRGGARVNWAKQVSSSTEPPQLQPRVRETRMLEALRWYTRHNGPVSPPTGTASSPSQPLFRVGLDQLAGWELGSIDRARLDLCGLGREDVNIKV